MKDFRLEAEKICNCVEDISKGKIKNKEDLFRIVELALLNDRMDLLEKLSFHAKYSQGLISVIQKSDVKVDEEYFVKVKAEFLETIEKIKSNLDELITYANDFLKAIFKNKYFELSQQGIANLNELCSDLSFLKLYLNDNKRESFNNDKR